MLKELKQMPKGDVNRVRSELNLSDEEGCIFDLFVRKKSIQQIADAVGLSTRTVLRRIKDIDVQYNRIH